MNAIILFPLQCIVIVILNNIWSSICKVTIRHFSTLVERCNETPIRRRGVRKLLQYLDDRESDRVMRQGAITESEYNHEHMIEVNDLEHHVLFVACLIVSV